MNWLAFVSIISAAIAVSFGAIGPALAEGRARGLGAESAVHEMRQPSQAQLE